jgi:hypothetical protein
MARPAKLLSTSGCESRQGKSVGRLVADPSAGEKSLVPSGVTEASFVMEGASARPVTRVNPRRGLDRFSTERARRLSRPCHGEGNRLTEPQWRVKALWGKPSAGLLRGRGDGTCARPAAEQERPSSVVLEWARPAYKAESEIAGCREGVRRGHSTDEARTKNLVEGRPSTLIGCGETDGSGDCPRGLADQAQFGVSLRIRAEGQGPGDWLESSFPKIIGKPYAGNPHVRFEREGLP